MLTWMSYKTRKDRIRYENIRDICGQHQLKIKLEKPLKIVSHVYGRPKHVLVQNNDGIQTILSVPNNCCKKKRKTKLNLVIDGMNELKTRNLIKVIVFNCTGSEI